MKAILAATTRAEAAGIIPHGGGAVAILIASLVTAIVAATVAVEMHRSLFLWSTATFLGTFVLISAFAAVL